MKLNISSVFTKEVPPQRDTVSFALRQKRYSDAANLLVDLSDEELELLVLNNKIITTEAEISEYIHFLEVLKTHTEIRASIEIDQEVMYLLYTTRTKYAELYNTEQSTLGDIAIPPLTGVVPDYLTNNKAILAAQDKDIDQLYTLIQYELPFTHYGKVLYYNAIEQAVKDVDHPLTKDILETIRCGRPVLGEEVTYHTTDVDATHLLLRTKWDNGSIIQTKINFEYDSPIQINMKDCKGNINPSNLIGKTVDIIHKQRRDELGSHALDITTCFIKIDGKVHIIDYCVKPDIDKVHKTLTTGRLPVFRSETYRKVLQLFLT